MTHVTRGKVSVYSPSRLKGRAIPTRKSSFYWSTCIAKVLRVKHCFIALCQLVGNDKSGIGIYKNRERELGLDRRETG